MQEIWNEKFKKADFLYGEKPNEFIKESIHLLQPNARVICLGEGEGRNALFLAQNGFKTEALDASDVGLQKLQKKALQENIAVTIRHTLIENWQPHGFYDAVITSYMHLSRGLQKDTILKSFLCLNDGGYLIAEVFSVHHLKFNSFGPKDENLLYNLSELYNIFTHIPCHIIKLSEELIELDEGVGHKGKANVIRFIIQKDREVTPKPSLDADELSR